MCTIFQDIHPSKYEYDVTDIHSNGYHFPSKFSFEIENIQEGLNWIHQFQDKNQESYVIIHTTKVADEVLLFVSTLCNYTFFVRVFLFIYMLLKI